MNFNSNLLEKLCKTYGPSGREKLIRNIIVEEIKDFIDDIKVDTIGNVIAHKAGNGKKIVLTAHMDQIGLMLRAVDEKGRFRILPIGSVKPYNMIDTRIETEQGEQGIVLCEKVADNNIVTCDDLYIEFGKNHVQTSELNAMKGNTVTISSNYYENQDSIISAALDDRMGCYILIETIKNINLCTNDMYFVFSVQEENGFHGIKSAISDINPDLVLAVDVACCNEELRGLKTDLELGSGLAIKVMDHFMIVSQEVVDWIKKVAIENKINYQLDISNLGGTDACAVQELRAVKVGALCIPTKNIHSSNEMISKYDICECLKMTQKIAEVEYRI